MTDGADGPAADALSSRSGARQAEGQKAAALHSRDYTIDGLCAQRVLSVVQTSKAKAPTTARVTVIMPLKLLKLVRAEVGLRGFSPLIVSILEKRYK